MTDIVEKPEPDQVPESPGSDLALIAPSLYAVTADILPYLDRLSASPRGEFEFTSALRLLIADGARVGGLLVDRRLTLTRQEDLLALNLHFLNNARDRRVVRALVPSDITVLPPILIEEGAIVGRGSTVGPSAYLEGGCRVAPGAVVRRCVILRGGLVDPNQVVDGAVVDRTGTTTFH